MVAVGGVGLSKVGAAVMKDVSQETQTGLRLLIERGNLSEHTGGTEENKIEITSPCSPEPSLSYITAQGFQFVVTGVQAKIVVILSKIPGTLHLRK